MMKADDVSSVTGSTNDFSSSFSAGEETRLGESSAAAPVLGRDREQLEIREAYQRVLQTQESHIVFVHGTSGQGKTVLIDALRDPVCETNGYFCSGKFFQDPGIQEPYSAITAAFSDLCDLVVQSPELDEKSSEFDVKYIRKIHEFLALHGHLLSRSVNFSPFFLDDSSDQISRESCMYKEEEKVATLAMFKAACKAFLLVMASRKHPVVLFIDDVQWMDNGSAKLLDLMKADDIKNVMLIFSYRDEDSSAVQGLQQSYSGARVTDIQLSNLDLAGVSQIVAYQLGSTGSDIDDLSELALQRTGGNPFFVSLFLETLGRDHFITMNGTSLNFDVDKIRGVIMVAESIADCLSQKVSHLSSDVKEVLTVASLVGYSFDEEILLEVPDIIKSATTEEDKREKLFSLLKLALQEGYIERYRGGYQFAHDKVQCAFQDLVDEASRDHLHFLIGNMFLLRANPGSIYNAVVHLNLAPEFLHCKEQSIRLARINLDASRFCKKTSAFDMAVSLLRKGLELLDAIQVKWSREAFDLSMELTESLAKMSLLIGDFDACFEATREAICHVDTNERKVSLLLINVECRMAKNDMEGSIHASIEALSELGVKYPRKATISQTVFKLSKVKFMMSKKTDEDIQALPRVEVGSASADAVRLLMHITFYSVMTNEIVGSLYAALLALEMTLQRGVSTYAAPALANFAVATMNMGNVERAYSLGKLALRLMQQNPSREADCATLGFVNPLVLHWKEPVCDLRDTLLAAATAGFDSGGDVVYSTYCISHGISMELFDGIHLGEVERSLRSHYNRIHDLGQDELEAWVLPTMQYVANLRSSSADWHELAHMSGPFMEPLTGTNAIDNQVLVKGRATLLKARLANVFGFHGIARDLYTELEPLEQMYNCTFVFNTMCWDACVAYYEGFIADGDRKHLRKARKYKKTLERRDTFGPNASTYLKHLNLKETFLRRKRKRWTDLQLHNDTCLRLLDRELEQVSLSDSFGKQPCYAIARAYADAGSIAERMGCVGKAHQYYERASEVYSESWGATTPAAWLDDKCETLPRILPQGATFDNQDLLVGDIVVFGRGEE